MDRHMSESLDRHITGNYGEDSIDGGSEMSWSVWGDSEEPVATGLSVEEMKRMVNEDATETLYGENGDGTTYEGE